MDGKDILITDASTVGDTASHNQNAPAQTRWRIWRVSSGTANSIDVRVGPFYSNRKGQVGLLVAAWNGSQWLQMISPGTPDQPSDAFTQLAEKIRSDRTFNPQPLQFDELGRSLLTDSRLQELEDLLKGICARSDFDW